MGLVVGLKQRVHTVTEVEDHGTYVVKTERPGFPEAEQYAALNAAGAPVVKLLDVVEGDRGGASFSRKRPLSVDTSTKSGFDQIMDWVVEFNSAVIVEYPACNLAWRPR